MESLSSGPQHDDRGTEPQDASLDQATRAPDGGSQGAESGASQGQQDRSLGISRFMNSFLRGKGESQTVDANENRSRVEPSEADGDQEQPTRAATDKSDRQAQPQPKPTPQRPAIFEGDPDEPLTMTRAELRKTVQSERDRIISAENRRNEELAGVRATAELYQQLEEYSDPETGDPEKLMEVARQLAQSRNVQTQQAQRLSEINAHVKATGDAYDDRIVRPVLGLLPPEVAQKIVDESPAHLQGIEHREYILLQALDAIKTHLSQGAENKARQRLQRSDMFRKEVLHEATDRRPEPEVVEAIASNGAAKDMNTWLHDFLRK